MALRLGVVFGRVGRIHSRFMSTVTQQPAQQNYQYSFSGHHLTVEQRNSYEKNGFLLVKKLIPEEDLTKYKDRFQKICNGQVTTKGIIFLRDVKIVKRTPEAKGPEVVTRISDLHFDDVLFPYCFTPSVVEYVKEIIGPNCMVMHSMVLNKPPDPGTKTSRHPIHQDLHYFPFRPANRIVCAWTAMETVHRDNGCLVVVPGTHQGELMEHEYPDWKGGVNKGYHAIKNYDPSTSRVSLEMEPGDTVFFHPLLWHGSGANKTKGFRRAISSHFAASECEYIDVRGTSQDNIAEEMSEIFKRKSGKGEVENFDYTQVYKSRVRLVAGRRINL